MLNKIKQQLQTSLPAELAESLLSEYEKLKENYLLNKHEPSELNAGKFCEVVVRIIQHQTAPNNQSLPLNRPITNFIDTATNFQNLPSTINDSFRLHIPRVLIGLYNIRNQRGVGHIGGDVNPNVSDSTFLTTGCDWILAELIRIFYSCSITEAENMVKNIIKRKTVLVYDIDGRKRVIKIKQYDKKVLVLLLEQYPNKVADSELFKWTEHSHFTVFKALLKKMHSNDLIDYHNDQCLLLGPGLELGEKIVIENR